jgi:hypothetical protein
MKTRVLLALVGLATGFVVRTFAQEKHIEAVVTAAKAFLATLSTSQLAAVKYDYTLANAEVWSNVPIIIAPGNGLKFGSLTSAQLAAALALAEAALSTTGYTLFAEIRAADDELKAVSSHYWGSGNYCIAFIGTPSAESAWMLQIDGHHLAYNLTFNGKLASGTPMFAGVEPRTWTANGTTHAPLEAQRAAIPVVGLKALHLNSSNLGLLFTSMGIGSVIGAVFIIPWLRARFSPDSVVLSANILLISVYILIALIRQRDAFFIVAALAGVGWTVSASELWLAVQRAMPNRARGRMNATVIMISQGTMALGGVIWGSADAIAGTGYTLFAASVLFLTSLFLARRLSINFARNREERAPGCLPTRAEPLEVTPPAQTMELLTA